MGFFGNIQEKTQQLKEKTQNSRQKLKVSAKSKTRFAENGAKTKPALMRTPKNFPYVSKDAQENSTSFDTNL